jgi:hypothetical protein
MTPDVHREAVKYSDLFGNCSDNFPGVPRPIQTFGCMPV